MGEPGNEARGWESLGTRLGDGLGRGGRFTESTVCITSNPNESTPN